jgi:hypothetical protein
MVNAACLAASLHGYVDLDGRVRFKKELSHTAGYSDARAEVTPFETDVVPREQWFGYKLIVRNRDGDRGVHLEAWIDFEANNVWKKVTETNDTGDWNARDAGLDDCDGGSFGSTTSRPT